MKRNSHGFLFFCPQMLEFNFKYYPKFAFWKQKLIYWAEKQYASLSYFDGNNYTYPQQPFANLLFAWNKKIDENDLWNDQFNQVKIGIIAYDFKNSLEALSSSNPPIISLPNLCFFSPELSFCFEGDFIKSQTKLSEEFWGKIENFEIPLVNSTCETKAQITKAEYIANVNTIQNYIWEGETYEMNFCQAFEGNFIDWDPIDSFFQLQEISPMPFSSLFKAEDKWLISASPERF